MNFFSEDSPAGPLDFFEGEQLRIAVLRAGAEMVSLQARDASGGWRSFLYRNGEVEKPDSGWGNHATVMGYFLHRLLGEQSSYRGFTIRGGNHGFIRHFTFDPPCAEGNSLTYSVPGDRVPRDAYPYPVSMDLSYEIDGNRLKVTFRFTNPMPDLTAHVSFGLHPGFGVSSAQTCRLDFAPGRYIRHFAPGNFLDGATEAVEHDGGEPPINRSELPGSFLFGLSEVPHPVFQIEDTGRRVILDFTGVPFMTVWSDGGPFICIEPCWGLPDSDPQTPFDQKMGIQEIPPNESLTASFSIQLECI